MDIREDAEIINRYLGLTPTEKKKSEIRKYLIERQVETFARDVEHGKRDAHCLIPNVSTIHYVDEAGKYAALGLSQPRDLLTNNFGYLLRHLFSSGNVEDTFPDVNNDPRVIGLKYIDAVPGECTFGQGSPVYMQLGSGSTIVTRADYKIQTALASAPESSRQLMTNNMGYGSGECVQTTNIGPFGATETVREGAVIIQMNHASVSLLYFTIARYNYTPTSIPIGQTAVIETTISV